MAEHEEQTSNLDAALERQQSLLENSLPAVFSAYDEAVRRKVTRPLVFLLDCEDEIGGEVARAWLGAHAVADAIEQRQLESDSDAEQGRDETTVFAHAFPFDQCRREVPQVFPYLESLFEMPLPSDGILAIVVACGGASALTVPFSAREDNR